MSDHNGGEQRQEFKPGDASNKVRITLRKWFGVTILYTSFFVAAPHLWKRMESFEPGPDYRMPYDLSNDYWLYARYVDLKASQCDTLLFGDSVIWGQYVTPRQTLSHYLNKLAGQESFANLGLDGAHPAALSGLVKYYAGSARGKNVIVECNFLWMSSARLDLEDHEEFRFNHPGLVPQFIPCIPCYKADYSSRIGIVVEQNFPFSSWTSHLQQAYFNQIDIPSWTLEHPYANPLGQITLELPRLDDTLRHEPISWTARNIKKQDFSWVDPEKSLQLQFFQKTVELLQRRANHVFVLVGPFNEHMLQEKSKVSYLKLKNAVEAWLQEGQIPYLAPEPLPSELYADASHPLAEGYELLAGQVFAALSRK